MESGKLLGPSTDMMEAMESAVRTVALLKFKLSSVTSVCRDENGWRVMLELVERAAVPDSMDILGLYELHLDNAGRVICYERVRVRRRGDVDPQ